MRTSLKLLAVPVLLMTLTGASCSTLEGRLSAAAKAEGEARVSRNLPDWPDDCRTREPHAAVPVGAEVLSVLKRERSALDRQNSRTDRCAGFYDTLANK